MTASLPPRVALYVRVSTKWQADAGMSIEDQKTRLTAHCQAKGWSIAGIYEDPGVTAKTMNRPGLKQLLIDAERKPREFDMVLAMDNSRLSRVTSDFLAIHALLARRSIGLACLNLPDGMGPEGKLMATVVASFSEFDNMLRAKRVQQVMESNAINGYWNGGHPPFGYRAVAVAVDGKLRTRKQLEIDPKEAETVRRIFALRLKGIGKEGPMGVGLIAKEISISKDLTRSDRPWSMQAINDILRDTTYIGQHRYHLHHLESDSEKNTQVRDVVVMPCPAIVDAKVFNRVQAMLDAANPKMQAARLTNGSLMLTGLLHCSACGAMMHVVTGKGGRYRYHACGHRHRTKGVGCAMPNLPLEMAEDAVTGALRRIILAADRIRSLAASIQHAIGAARAPLEAELRSKQTAFNASERRRKAIVRRLADVEGRSLKELKLQLKNEETAGTRLANEVTILRARMRQRVSPIGPIHHQALTKLVSDALQNGALVLRQDIARQLIEQIAFDGSQLSVRLRTGALESVTALKAA